MELLILALVFYFVGRDAETIQTKSSHPARLKCLANIAAGIFSFLFLLGMLKYGVIDLIKNSLNRGEFYSMFGMFCIWLGYIARVKQMPDFNKASNYYSIYRNFNYRQSLANSLKVVLCDALGIISLLLSFKF